MFQNHIIEKCKQNNRKAQMQLYNQYCQGMYIVAKRFVKHEAEAEDVVQDAFIKAFSKLHQYQAEVTFGAWLKRIVELEEVHLKVVDASDEDKWLVDDAVSIDNIKEAINNLSEKYRYVVMLYLIEGYDHQEISEILKISEVASRTQLYRGKLKLQELLKHTKDGTRS